MSFKTLVTLRLFYLKKFLLFLFFTQIPFLGICAPMIVRNITNWEAQVRDAFDASTVIFGFLGTFYVFVQYMQGNPDAQKNLVKVCIGLALYTITVNYLAQVFIP